MILLVISLAVPALMLALHCFVPKTRFWYGAAALVSMYVFGLVAADAVAGILLRGTVMMTEVHRIFYNPLFLAAGAYLGLYGFYRGWIGLLRHSGRWSG
ncbi:hypothetical protein [Paenibacillus sp. KR2-11]|uniref:hypothetical protein n=1 Tax=Paenibacillus sp. KR2-11 TaxID=3385500 RepID=UPI0038FC4A8B